MTIATAREIRVPDGGWDAVSTVHDLFVETLGKDAVEDLASFRRTVSPHTDPQVAPKLVTVYDHSRSGNAQSFKLHSVSPSRVAAPPNSVSPAKAGIQNGRSINSKEPIGRGGFQTRPYTRSAEAYAHLNDRNCRHNPAGAMLGLYLRRLNGSIILYAGVREPFRRQGLYTEMRTALLSELAKESPTGPAFLLSDQEEGSWLLTKYLDDWDAFVAPMDYVQPAVQGLSRRRLNLVVAPQAADRQEIIEVLPAIVREVYTSVYRIPELEDNADFRQMVASLGMP